MRKLLTAYIFTLVSFVPLWAFAPMAGGDSDFEITEDATHLPAMIMVEDADVEETIADLESQGIIILRHRENILLALIPVDWEEQPLMSSEGVHQKRKARGIKKIEYSKPRKNRPLMDHARLFNNAHLINEGMHLPQPYDGTGVVVGVCDIGMDTRHPNFLNQNQTECRIRKVVHYRELQGTYDVYTTPEDIYEWQTDTPDDWHGTHVTGIAAGAHLESNYQGLAPGADIVFTASQLSDVGLLAGVEDIIDYAKEVGKPAVINLSMGNNTGPHDGTSLFTRYLDMCADDAIICISAGNEGYWTDNGVTSHTQDFTEGNTVYKIRCTDYGGTDYAGIAEVWSRDDTPFSLMFYWYNDTRAADNLEPYSAILSADGDIVEWRISTDPDDPDYDETFDAHFTEGYVKVTAGISPLNGRYYANVEFELKTDELHGNTAWAEYWAALKLEAEPGTHIDMSVGGPNIRLRPERNIPRPNNEMSLSDLATGYRTISVGMMNNTDYLGDDIGRINPHSSYATLNDGRKMPVTVAPGAYVISSISSAFLEKHPEELPYTDYETDYNGKTVYWIGTIGTSMSCPFVAGAIATWLQAYPQLTADQALEIVRNTNQTSGYPDPDNPRHGQGWFNAYKGLQEVINISALKVGTIDSPEITLRVEKDILHIANPAGYPLSISVYNPAGMLVEQVRCDETLGYYSLGHLPGGIYIIRAAGKTLKVRI